MKGRKEKAVIIPSLSDLLNSDLWQKMPKRGTFRDLQDDGFVVQIGQGDRTKEKIPRINRISVRMGVGVLKKMQWKDGDKIEMLNHKDNLMHFILFKNSNGRILKHENGRLNIFRLQIVWPYNKILQLHPMKSTEHEYEAHKEYLSFVLKNPKE